VKIVVDTNILLVSISRFSPYHWLFETIIEGKITLCISNEILFEYEEIISKKFNRDVANFVIETIMNLPNIDIISQYFRWQLIQQDPDDNKFVDCAITSGADYIITHDKHFHELNSVDFPKVNILSLKEFEQLLTM
jgi:putative PIN family toxin of toxin-antitoxin system